jgi:hypothetical protein
MLVNFPRNALLWLLLSMTCVYLPLQLQLGAWTSLVFLAVVSWRWMMHLGRWPYPTKAAKVVVVVLGITAVLVSAQGRFHLESATSFILVAGLLKVLEIKTQRDGYIVIFLSYFLLAVNFLYEQGIFTALYSLLAIWVLTSALISLHQTEFSEHGFLIQIKEASTISGQVLLLSLPIMLLMFVLFPRLDPLWTLKLQSSQAKTGLSESMRPGDIAQLSNSDELVFRVEFQGKQPSSDLWYWRALVLDKYVQREGKSVWSSSGIDEHIEWFPNAWQPTASEQTFDYTVIQEATDKNWLIGLRGLAAMESGIGMTESDLLQSKQALYQRKSYSVRSWPDVSIAEQGLSKLVENQNLQLGFTPTGNDNPRSRQLAETINAQFEQDEDKLAAALQFYSSRPFVYTLKPELMAENDIDDFLFEKQAGFCAHYSGSFVFLMRAMGIPARIVAGYQGGELNQESGHITVRQYDAHAWVEVWLEGIGWRSYDPTALVAPDRINLGLRQTLEQEFSSQQGMSLLSFSHFGWLNDLRLQLDQLNYYWHQRVLNFNKNRQANLLKQWFGLDALKESLYWLAALFCLIFVFIALLLLWRKPKQKRDRLSKGIDKFDRKLLAIGLQKQTGEGLKDYSERLQAASPKNSSEIQFLFTQVQHYYYADHDQGRSAEVKQLVKRLQALARKLVSS